MNLDTQIIKVNQLTSIKLDASTYDLLKTKDIYKNFNKRPHFN